MASTEKSKKPKQRKPRKSTRPKRAVKRTPSKKKLARIVSPSATVSLKPAPSHLKLYLFLSLLVAGILMMAGGGFYWLYRQTILSFKVAPVYQVTAENRGSAPQHIKVGSVGIDLPITPANIVDGVWETSDTSATHLSTSARPGEKSNIVIYGHNFSHLFKALHQVNEGETVSLTTEDGHTYQYVVTSKTVVTPDQIEVVLPTKHEELTLYTCTGFLDSKRLIIKASPISVSYSL